MPSKKRGNRFIHDAMVLDKPDTALRHRLRVLEALTGPRVRHLDIPDRQPVGVRGLLFFELSFKGAEDILDYRLIFVTHLHEIKLR